MRNMWMRPLVQTIESSPEGGAYIYIYVQILQTGNFSNLLHDTVPLCQILFHVSEKGNGFLYELFPCLFEEDGSGLFRDGGS